MRHDTRPKVQPHVSIGHSRRSGHVVDIGAFETANDLWRCRRCRGLRRLTPV